MTSDPAAAAAADRAFCGNVAGAFGAGTKHVGAQRTTAATKASRTEVPDLRAIFGRDT